MLFRKKDTSDSSKAKTSFFASRSKKKEAEKLEKESSHVDVASQADATKTKATKTLKTTVASGKTDPSILIGPRITEKATNETTKNTYTFNVASSANKKQVAEAIKDVYGVRPVGVRIARIPAKKVTNRKGGLGTKSGGKKAYVELKKGDTIELV